MVGPFHRPVPDFPMISLAIPMKARVAAAFLLVPEDAANRDPALRHGYKALQAGRCVGAARLSKEGFKLGAAEAPTGGVPPRPATSAP